MRVDARSMGVTTGAIAAAAIALTAVLMTGAGSAQTSPEASKLAAADRKTVTMQYGGWKVTCDETGDQSRPVCSAAFRVFDKNTNNTILTWLVGHSRDGRLLSEFYVPTEVLIGPGVSMVLEDGPAYKADFVACGRSACKAILALDAALASELASATQATLSLTASNGKVTRFSMAIDGIEAALTELGN
jgi:invasion protein IalB